jgi:triosephosphate isomerase (TIM)
MNLNKKEVLHLFGELELSVDNLAHAEVYVFAPFVYLDALNVARNADGLLHVGAQHFYPAQSGAFTGEISLDHLKDLGVSTVLIGHSERRNVLHEDEDFLKQKVNIALAHNFTVFFCCGEPDDVRERGTHFDFVEEQLRASLLHLEASNFKKVVIAYEPVWAIGTGKTASNEQANEMHQHIRDILRKLYGKDVAEQVRILYGGSCNPTNAAGLFSMSDIDGGLIGAASLEAGNFMSVINAAR